MTQHDISYQGIFRFYLPLVLNAQMMFLSAPFINLGLSRTSHPELAIAAYSVGFSFMVFLNSPSIASRNISTALMTDRDSFLVLRRIFLGFGALITLTACAIAITPLHGWIFLDLLATPPDVAREVRQVLLIIAPIGIFVAIRGVYQGVALIQKKTSILAYATLVRLTTISSIVLISAVWLRLPGASAGALAIMSGMAVEALFVVLQTRALLSSALSPSRARQPRNALTLQAVARFSGPILIGMYVVTFQAALVNGIISRSASPEMALAGFGVVYPIMRFVTSPILGFQSTTLVLYTSWEALKKLTVAVLAISGIFCLILLGLALSPLGHMVLLNLFALEPDLLAYASPGLFAAVVFPLVLGIRCHAQGILMNLHRPKAISISALSKVVLILSTGAVLLGLFPSMNGVVLGIALMTLGEVCDTLIMGGVALRAARARAIQRQQTPPLVQGVSSSGN